MFYIECYGPKDVFRERCQSQEEGDLLMLDSANIYAKENDDEVLRLIIECKDISGVRKHMYDVYDVNCYVEG